MNQIETIKFKSFTLFAPKKLYLKEHMQGAANLKKKEREQFRSSNITEDETHSTYVITSSGTMFVSAYIINNDFFDAETSNYVPINEYCQSYIKENPVDNYGIFIFKRLGAIVVINQGMVDSYIGGIESYRNLIQHAKDLIKSTEVKGFKDTKVFTDEFFDPFSSELINFDKLSIYKKMDSSQKIKNPKVSFFSNIFSRSGSKEEKTKSLGALKFLIPALIVGQAASAYFLYEGEKNQEQYKKEIAYQEKKIQQVSKSLKETKEKIQAINTHVTSGVNGPEGGGVLAQKIQDLQLQVDKLTSSNPLTSANASERVNEILGAESAVGDIKSEVDGFLCKVSIKSSRYMVCEHNGKAIRLPANKTVQLSNGMALMFMPQTDSVKVEKDTYSRLFLVSKINR